MVPYRWIASPNPRFAHVGGGREKGNIESQSNIVSGPASSQSGPPAWNYPYFGYYSMPHFFPAPGMAVAGSTGAPEGHPSRRDAKIASEPYDHTMAMANYPHPCGFPGALPDPQALPGWMPVPAPAPHFPPFGPSGLSWPVHPAPALPGPARPHAVDYDEHAASVSHARKNRRVPHPQCLGALKASRSFLASRSSL